jgi:hypothetical protein
MFLIVAGHATAVDLELADVPPKVLFGEGDIF